MSVIKEITVIKRDGRKVNFDSSKIESAVLKSFLSVDGEITEFAKEKASKIASYVESRSQEETLSIEQIQDLVENGLMATKRKDVAKAYILYRNERTKEREKDSIIVTKVINRANAKINNRMNANVDEDSFSGREKEASADIGKTIALEFGGLSERVAKAHKEMDVYQHDLEKAIYGVHNCSFIDFKYLYENGFVTRNGDVRPPKSFSSACQLKAVIFQCQSQVQFGGCGSLHADIDLAPFVAISFKKIMVKNYIKEKASNNNWDNIDILNWNEDEFDEWIDNNKENFEFELDKICIDNKGYPTNKLYNETLFDLFVEGRQATQALYHNLNTLESRQGSQVPFTSLNLGRDTTTEGRLVTQWIFEASLNGIGKHHQTSIFPISIFQYKQGINSDPGDPNYDLKQLALKSLSKRIYPNFVNCDWSGFHEDPNDPDTWGGTMGCVDGKEVITYKFKNQLFVESFERMWNRMSLNFEIKHQYVENNPNLYIDLTNVSIFDNKICGFTDCKRIIRNISDKWLDINFSNGRRILCTADHPFEIINKGIVHGENVSIGDSIYANYGQYSEENYNINPELAWTLGLILCDGCYSNRTSVVTSLAAKGEDDIINRYNKNMKEIFNINTKNILRERGPKGNYIDIQTINDSYNVNNFNNFLTSIFEGVQKEYRHIPNSVFEWNYTAKLAFLAGMIDADGYINNNRRIVVQIGSTNKELAIQQMLLAQSCGMQARLYFNHYNSEKIDKIRYRVEFAPSYDLIQFIASKKKINNFITKPIYFDSDTIISDYNSDRVTVVSKEYIQKIDYSYDVTTSSEHFEVSGIYSHNCRTLVGFDRHGMNYKRVGRGNNVPVTVILPKIGIKNGICLGKRTEPDLENFWKELEYNLETAEIGLLERYDIIKSQSPKSAPFMYQNKTMCELDYDSNNVEEAVKHGSLALGFIGIAEMCTALFGKNHAEDKEVHNFALKVVERIYKYTQEASERNNLNFSCYFTPAEGLCRSALKSLRDQFGIIKNVTDREYLTNSTHVPVWMKLSIFDKLNIEAPFTKYASGGSILYIELDSTFVKNTKSVEQIIDYAFKILDVPYLAFNFPIDNCIDCGYQGEFDNCCPECNSKNIRQLRRVTGYLTTDYRNFNDGKYAETNDRVKHTEYTSQSDFEKMKVD